MRKDELKVEPLEPKLQAIVESKLANLKVDNLDFSKNTVFAHTFELPVTRLVQGSLKTPFQYKDANGTLGGWNFLAKVEWISSLEDNNPKLKAHNDVKRAVIKTYFNNLIDAFIAAKGLTVEKSSFTIPIYNGTEDAKENGKTPSQGGEGELFKMKKNASDSENKLQLDEKKTVELYGQHGRPVENIPAGMIVIPKVQVFIYKNGKNYGITAMIKSITVSRDDGVRYDGFAGVDGGITDAERQEINNIFGDEPVKSPTVETSNTPETTEDEMLGDLF